MSILKKLSAIILLFVLALVGVIFYGGKNSAVAINPLGDDTDTSRMLISSNEEISASKQYVVDDDGIVDESETKEADNSDNINFSGDNPTVNDNLPGNNIENSSLSADDQYFTTSITDGETVYSSDYRFTITHLKKDLTVTSEKIYVNSIIHPNFNGSVQLTPGKNTIKIAIIYTNSAGEKISVYGVYTVYYGSEDDAALLIDTNLQEGIVHDENLSFYVRPQSGGNDYSAQVYLNGKALSGGENYTATLSLGSNTIRVKLTSGVQTVSKNYIIKYVPYADEKTAPKLEYINIKNNMKIVGSKFTLDLKPVDYKGNRIYYDGITVLLNGTTVNYNWTSEYTSYLLYLVDGTNSINIRITDKDGRYTDYSYKITCEIVPEGTEIGRVTISVDANVLGLGYIVAPCDYPIHEGETGAEFITSFLTDKGIGYNYAGALDNGFYLARISDSGITRGYNIPAALVEEINADGLEWKDQIYENSLGEFDFCQGSGWVYSINGSFTGFSMSDAVLKDGDTLCIRFTLAYGRDVAASIDGLNYKVTY